MEVKSIVKPREEKKALKERVELLRPKLPTNWIVLFTHDNREYKGEETFLAQVIAGRSLSAGTIDKIEEWVKTL